MSAIDALVEALNHSSQRALVAHALEPEVVIARHRPAARGEAGAVAQRYEGLAAAEEWIALVRAGTIFRVVGEPMIDAKQISAEYEIRFDDFVNGGTWLAKLGEGGRIAALEHQPFALADGV